MFSIFIELAHLNGGKIMVNVNRIETITRLENTHRGPCTRIDLQSETSWYVKETPEEISRMIVKEREYLVMEVLERMNGEGYIQRY